MAPNGTPPQVVIPGTGWVELLSRVVVQVGFPVVVAAVLLWFLLTTFQSNMNKIAEHMGQNTKGLERLLSTQDQQLQELKQQTEALKSIARDTQRHP